MQDAPGYEYRVVTVHEAVDRSVSGEWDVPEFQRQFVWNTSQVCAIADSLWRCYPIGALLLWRASPENDGGPRWWIADGQHRLTALCMLYGREPAWLHRKTDEYRSRMMRRHTVRFDPASEGDAAFAAACPGTARNGAVSIPVEKLMALDPRQKNDRDELDRLAADLASSGQFHGLDRPEICRRLTRVSMIREHQLAATCVRHERPDVLEIFQRLNSRGMRFRKLLLKLAMEEIPAAIRRNRGR
jgi:hypothetical protein